MLLLLSISLHVVLVYKPFRGVYICTLLNFTHAHNEAKEFTELQHTIQNITVTKPGIILHIKKKKKTQMKNF